MTVPKKNSSHHAKRLLSKSIGLVDDTTVELERLRTLLIGPEILKLDEVRRRIANIERQIQDPTELIELLLPVTTELLNRKMVESGEMIANALAPFIDQVIRKKIRQDKASIAKALAPIISDAIKNQALLARSEIATALAPVISATISQRISESSDEVAKALAPIMGAAIKEQANSQRKAVVDALYPVIGNTITKYLSEAIKNLTRSISQSSKSYLLIIATLVLFCLIFISLGIYGYRNSIDRTIEARAARALALAPELSIYRLNVNAHRGTLQLSGIVPNENLRLKAEEITRKAVPTMRLKNLVRAVEVPADPVLAAAEVKRVASILNEMKGISVLASYKDGHVIVEGTVFSPLDTEKVAKSFEQIPGVRTLTISVRPEKLILSTRVYFDLASAKLRPSEENKIFNIKKFLDQYPDIHLRILGHTDPRGSPRENYQLALNRANAVREALVTYDVDASRLQVDGTPEPPPDVDATQPMSLGRCVRFESVEPVREQH